MDDPIEKLAEDLVLNGVAHAFGVTGSGASLRLITALEEKGVRYTPATDEGAAALMAGAVTRASGKPAVSISVKGPGLANMIAGIASNKFENIPAISISESFGDDSPSSFRHKRLDHRALLAPVVKGRLPLNQIKSHLKEHIQLSRSEAPGPIHIDLCTESKSIFKKYLPPKVPKATVKIFDQIKKSKRPVLIVGSLALRREWGKKLSRLKIPLFWTAVAKGVLSETHPWGAGVVTGTGKDLAPETHVISQSDLVIGLGLRDSEMVRPLPSKSIVGFDEIMDAHNVFFLDKKTESFVFEFLEEKEWGHDLIQESLSKMREALLDSSWLPAPCFEYLNSLNYDYALVTDTGSFTVIAEHIWHARPERPYYGSCNGRFMGTAIPTSVGVALADTRRPVFCFVGDGGMEMYTAEIKTMVAESLPICLVLLTDGSFGSIAGVSQKYRPSQKALLISNPSWIDAVTGMGCPGTKVESLSAFKQAIESWNQKGPSFIEAPFDRESYRTMTARLRQ
jgi:acetolactate synthase-1/2/3 large subunit